jgi:hypothetical protein
MSQVAGKTLENEVVHGGDMQLTWTFSDQSGVAFTGNLVVKDATLLGERVVRWPDHRPLRPGEPEAERDLAAMSRDGPA